MIKIAFFDVDGTLLRLGHKELSANTVAAVLRHYGFSKDEAIAFGDGHNDIEMLEDLIVAAFNDATEKAEEVKSEKMGQFGGLGGLM